MVKKNLTGRAILITLRVCVHIVCMHLFIRVYNMIIVCVRVSLCEHRYLLSLESPQGEYYIAPGRLRPHSVTWVF